MLPNVGPMEMAILFVIVLIIFGPKSLPKIGQALGRGIREFKDAARGLTEMDDEPRNQPASPEKPKQQVPDTSAAAAQATPETNTTTEHSA